MATKMTRDVTTGKWRIAKKVVSGRPAKVTRLLTVRGRLVAESSTKDEWFSAPVVRTRK